METAEETLIEERTCRTCRAPFQAEVIPWCFGKTLALENDCPDCKKKADEEAAARARERAKVIATAKVLATLDPELLPVWLDPLGTDPERADFNSAKWEKVRGWRPGPHGNGLGLIGGAGTCKTRILALLAEKILMQGIGLFWTSAMRLHTEATYNRKSMDRKLRKNAEEYFENCMFTRYLVLDDFGNNEWSPSFESQLFTILDHRKNNRLPVLWSSNKDPEKFHLCITSVNPAALIGRLVGDTAILDFDETDELV